MEKFVKLPNFVFLIPIVLSMLLAIATGNAVFFAFAVIIASLFAFKQLYSSDYKSDGT